MDQLIFGLLTRQVSALALSDERARYALSYLVSRHHQALMQLESALVSDRPPDIEVIKNEQPSENNSGSTGNSEHISGNG